MKHRASNIFLLAPVVILGFLMSGCVVVDGGVEVAKTVWGSSTRAIERAREDAITKTYDKPYWDALRAAVDVAKKNDYEIFKRDEVKGYLVFVGVHGSVNTTEVGVFFVELGEDQVRVEVSSLSTNAKRIVSKTLFHGLDVAFGLVPSDSAPAEVVGSTLDNVGGK